jgi:hypothetical protein
MASLYYPITTKWVVAHNNVDVFHVSEVHPNNCFRSGQPFMDVFNTKEELLSAFPQLSSHFFPDYTDFITEIPEEVLEEELEG